MKHVVILFDEQDTSVAERLEKSMALMQRKGEIKTYSSLHIQPGQNIQSEIEEQIRLTEVSIIILSIDLSTDLIFDMLEKQKSGQTELLVVYANYVEQELLNEFYRHKIAVTPLMPIAQHENKDAAYRKINNAVRRHLLAKANEVKPATGAKNKRILLILLAARRNTQKE